MLTQGTFEMREKEKGVKRYLLTKVVNSSVVHVLDRFASWCLSSLNIGLSTNQTSHASNSTTHEPTHVRSEVPSISWLVLPHDFKLLKSDVVVPVQVHRLEHHVHGVNTGIGGKLN
jgi:hypothetical protein